MSVGFSYSEDPADYVTGDAATAADGYAFLLGFFARFPQFAAAPFWIAGESYAGHYVPQLVSAVLDGNANVRPPLQCRFVYPLLTE